MYVCFLSDDYTVLSDITEYIENNQDILDVQDPVDSMFPFSFHS